MEGMKETSAILGIYCLIFLGVIAAMFTLPVFFFLGWLING